MTRPARCTTRRPARRTTPSALAPLIACLALAVAAAPAAAGRDATADTQTYRVHKGDTLELIAAEFYGDRTHAIFIMVENKMKHPRPLRPGERLKIPISREITTSKGDTFETLAQTYLGDARRAPFLADFNSMSPEDSLATGTTLTIPFHVTHVAAGTETLASIAAAYFGDPRKADLLRRYNNLDKASLEKGESIVVPILHVRVRASKMPPIDAESRARREQQKKTVAEVAAALPAARTAWLQGDFERIKAVLVPFADKVDFLDTALAIEVGLLLGRAHVAYDDTPSAVAAFTQVINRQPNYELAPYEESPKVIAAWKQAGGRVRGE